MMSGILQMVSIISWSLYCFKIAFMLLVLGKKREFKASVGLVVCAMPPAIV